MLSYRHAFHAGNFADVLKQVVLMQLTGYLTRKDAALFYLDTHAGAGDYDLRSAYAEKTGEYRSGIGALWHAGELSEDLQAYVELIRTFNAGTELRTFPSCARLAERLLRPQDRLELCELHATDFALLEQVFRGDRRVHCRNGDGFGIANAVLPPRERRGLVFIDPSYEMKGDFGRVCREVQGMYRRFASGVYALWYPLIDRRRNESLRDCLRRSGLRDVLHLEIVLERDAGRAGMRGCGMFVVNPPFTLKTRMEPVMHELARHFTGPRPGVVTVEQFAAE